MEKKFGKNPRVAGELVSALSALANVMKPKPSPATISNIKIKITNIDNL